MGNTTVYPNNTAAIGCSVITVNQRVKEGNNGKLTVEQGETLVIPVASSKGFKIDDDGTIIRPDGNKTGSVMSYNELSNYNNYKKHTREIKTTREVGMGR